MHKNRHEIRERLRSVLRSLSHGQLVYATPASTQEPVRGVVVEVDRLTLALQTDDGGIVWVHGEDCPDLVGAVG